MTELAYVILGIIIGGLLILVLLFRAAWRVAEPDEALIVSGFRTSQRPDGVGESMGFRIVTGAGAWSHPASLVCAGSHWKLMRARSASRACRNRRFVSTFAA